MWYYINHLGGGLYSSVGRLSLDDLYCEQCNDYDEELGCFETEEEAIKAYDKYFSCDDEELEEDNVN